MVNLMRCLKSFRRQKVATIGADQAEESAGDEVINAIKKVCMQALPDKTFSIDDSLLELGASSLSLVEIHAGLDELYPDKIDITDLVDHSSIAALAEYIKTK